MSTSTVFSYFKKQTILPLLAATILLTAVSLILLAHVEEKRKFNVERLANTYDVIHDAETILSLMKDAETGQRGYLLTGNVEYLEPFINAEKNINHVLSSLAHNINDNPDQQQRLTTVESLIGQKLLFLQHTIERHKKDTSSLKGESASFNNYGGKKEMDAIREKMSEIIGAEKVLMGKRAEQLDFTMQAASITRWTISIITIVILLLGIRSIIKQLQSRDHLYREMEEKNQSLLFNSGIQSEHTDEYTVVKNLMDNLTNAKQFIQTISDRQYNLSYTGLTPENQKLNKHTLVGALLDMRNKMVLISEEEENRTWTAQGLSKFYQLLSSAHEKTDELFFQLTSNLVRYLGANQAGLFLLNDDNASEPVLELVSCYAYDRKKYIDKSIAIGQGLIGQAYLEKEPFYMTTIPENYVKITSGLGEATPKSLLIVPLKVNETILGMLEIASFEELPQYRIDFAIQLGETIGSALLAIQTKKRTNKLLNESHQQAEELRAQEEEVRQNMEELTSTQEEMARAKAQTETLLIEQTNQLSEAKRQEENLQRLYKEMENVRTLEQERFQIQMNSQKQMMTKLMEKSQSTERELKSRIQVLEQQQLRQGQ